MNLCTYFGDRPEWQTHVATTSNVHGLPEFFHQEVRIHRTSFPVRGRPWWSRILSFVAFPLCALWTMIRVRPDVVLYIEPHSSFAAFLYCCLLNRRCRLFIHYHENYERHQYDRPGMKIVRWFHRIEERWLYQRAHWISQTNQTRAGFFLNEYPQVDPGKMHVLANYPPAEWMNAPRSGWPENPGQPLRLVYVGALSVSDTFIAEVVNWVRTGPDLNVTLDVYTNNVGNGVNELFRDLTDERITLHSQPVPYNQLPQILSGYHAGLILYRGATRNYVHNATNKLFEYLMCGLDVWYPGLMEGVRPYAREDSIPRVLQVDFTRLADLDPVRMRSRGGLRHEPWMQSCESELAALEQAMKQGCECATVP